VVGLGRHVQAASGPPGDAGDLAVTCASAWMWMFGSISENWNRYFTVRRQLCVSGKQPPLARAENRFHPRWPAQCLRC